MTKKISDFSYGAQQKKQEVEMQKAPNFMI